MKNTTLCLLVRNEEILLSIKKKGLGKGKYNGFGGHVNEGEDIKTAAVRELREETGLVALAYEKVGEITYRFRDPKMQGWNELVHIYLVSDWQGTPIETEEMSRPEPFKLDEIPYKKMWENDEYWLRIVLSGKKIKGTIEHDEDKLHSCDITVVDSF